MTKLYFATKNVDVGSWHALSKVSRSSTSGNTQPIYEDDEDGVVPTLEALISFLLAELAIETMSWFDTRCLTPGTITMHRRFYITILGHVIYRLFGPRLLPPPPSQSPRPPSPPPSPPIPR